jgi:mono/diheme cytochrome c family protein
MKIFVTILSTLVGLLLVLVIFIGSGLYNIGAVKPHQDPVAWVIEETRDRSIVVHSKDIRVLTPRDDPRMITQGLDNYHFMCRWCHGAPGFNRGEFALGLYPSPPYLGSKDVQSWKDSELFWIMKNGIKMTGMPAFGPTHTDEQLWTTVAFLRRLPKLGPAKYKAMVEALPQQEATHHLER